MLTSKSKKLNKNQDVTCSQATIGDTKQQLQTETLESFGWKNREIHLESGWFTRVQSLDRDLLQRLLKDGLGHFPVVENFQEFAGNFLHRAKDFLQSDLSLGI